MKNVLYFLSFIIFSSVNVEAQSPEIEIIQPTQQASVGHQELVLGKVSDPNSRVYVLVHPMATKMWWVQRIPSPPNRDGSWSTLCYFGTENQGIGEYFEIVGIQTEQQLGEGQTLKKIPSRSVRSDIVIVKRSP